MSDSKHTDERGIKASDLFVKALENEGVTRIIGVPGEENLDLLESIRTSSIELVLTRHEQSAAFMAATYGRFTGRAGVCLSTLGPGATNLVTAAAYAKLGAMPMVMISGQKPVKTSKQGHFQIIDTVDMMRPLTKLTHQLVNVNNIPARTREAFRLAQEERPGPCHLELPEDIAAEYADPSVHLFEKSNVRHPHASDKSLEDAEEMIRVAKSPLVMVGAGANRRRVCDALANFIDQTGIPFFNTQMGKGVIDERHPLYLGTAALSEGDYLHCALDRTDLIINVGHDVVEKPPFFMEPNGVKVIHINFSSAIVDRVYFPQLEVVGDIAFSINQLTRNLGHCEHHDFSYFMLIKDEVEKQVLEGSHDDRFPMIPQRLVADIRQVMPDDGIIALDNGIYKLWFARCYKAHQPNTVLLDNALATMGAGLPSAMMAAMLHPDKPVMAICGDGGFMMNSQELETAVRLGLNLVVLVINDGAYGMIRWKQIQLGFTDWGLEFGNPDFVKYADAYGAQGHRIKTAAQLHTTLERAFAFGGVHVVDLAIDYSENERVLIDELAKRVCLI